MTTTSRRFATGLYAIALTVAVLSVSGCAARETRTVILGSEDLQVEIADDEASRSNGLQGHEPLRDGEGMLFSWEDEQVRTFAMKEVDFPIDVVFIDTEFRVSLIAPLEPGDQDPVSGPSPSSYVLELPSGWAEENGVDVGSPFVPPPGG